MKISNESVQEFKDMVRKEYGDELSDFEAREAAERISGFIKLIYRPLPEGKEPEGEDPEENLEDDPIAREVVLGNLEKLLVKTQKSFKGLTEMRYENLIGNEEFISEKEKLGAEITHLTERITAITEAANKQKEYLQDFDPTYYAQEWFKRGNKSTQRKIVQYMGSDWTIKDKKLNGKLFKYLFRPGEVEVNLLQIH